MVKKTIKFDIYIKTSEQTPTYSYTAKQKVMSNDKDSTQITFNLLDVAPEELSGSSASILLYMEDGSFFQKSDVTINRNSVIYTMKPEETRHSGNTKVQIVLNKGTVQTASLIYNFEIERGLEKFPIVEKEIQDWTSLTAEAKAFVQQIEGFTLESFVENKMGEELANLETNYATRLTGLETADQNLTAQLAETVKKDVFLKELAQTVKEDAFLKQTMDSLSYNIDKIVLAKDDFLSGAERLDSSWEIITGAFKITDNRLKGDQASTWNKAVVQTNESDGEVSAIVRSFAGAPRIIFRIKDTINYWFFGVANQDLPSLALGYVVDGNVTFVDGMEWTLSSSIGSKFRVVLDGKNIKGYVNNTLAVSTISDVYLSETKHGVSLYGTNGGLNRFRFEKETIYHPNNLIASVDDMYVSYDGYHFMLSEDGGRSYTKGFSFQEIEIVKYVHLFGDGKIMFAGHQKVYYSHDWKTYHEAEVFDYDGSKFVPETYDNFSCYKNGTVKKIVDGKELAVWGNYSTESGVQFSDKVKVWYTADKGSTVKCCYVFNTPNTLPCRHIHAVDFNPNDETFWIQTGDEPSGGVDMSHWVKGTYDVGTDTWIWNQFASGLAFKTTNMIFHTDGYVYWSWDKTPGGAVRAPIGTMGNVATHELLFETNKDCHFLIIGPSGDIAIFQTAWGGTEQPRIFYYAPDGINFVRIVGTMPYKYNLINDAQYQTYWPINSDGKVLAGVQSLSYQNIRDWDRKPSVFIDDIIRENGYPNAFK